MDTWTHTTKVRILTVAAATTALLVGPALFARAGSGIEISATSTPPTTPIVQPDITFLGDPSLEERAVVDWAQARFEEAKLHLPELRIEFEVSGCTWRGRYDRKTQTIQLCDGRKDTVLHELAHAWDHFATLDRDSFLRLRGLESYFGGPETPWAEKGAEHVAEIVAWGLAEENTAVPGPAYPSQPVADYQPRLPGIPDSGVEELHVAFVFLTGVDPLHSDRHQVGCQHIDLDVQPLSARPRLCEWRWDSASQDLHNLESPLLPTGPPSSSSTSSRPGSIDPQPSDRSPHGRCGRVSAASQFEEEPADVSTRLAHSIATHRMSDCPTTVVLSSRADATDPSDQNTRQALYSTAFNGPIAQLG